MIVDLSEQRDWAQYAYTIVGSGFAGQMLAEGLCKHGGVLVIEAGPLDNPLSLGAGYYEIDSTGLPTPSLGIRLSAFGGTSNHWTGQSRPFSPRIFENRDELGVAGWPIPYSEYAAYLPAAQAFLRLPPSYDLPDRPSLESGLLAGMRGLTTYRFFRPNPVQNLGSPAERERFLALAGIDVMPSTRVIDIAVDGTGRAISIDLADAAGRRLTIPINVLLLAAGGVENARLMLWSGRKYPAGNPLLGGPSALTGKYLTEHPVYLPAEVALDGRLDLSDGVSQDTTDSALQHFMWAPDDKTLRRHGLPRFAMLLYDEGLHVDEAEFASTDDGFLSRLQRPRITIPAMKFEQTPHMGSFVGLSDRTDRDGTPIARVHWTLAETDVPKFRRASLLLLGLLAQRGLVRSRLRPDYVGEDWSAIVPGRSAHQIGTTRMAHAASAGVVDADCRVFGTKNLYVAGSSVFPHGDFVNPTLSLLALTARLVEHLSMRQTVRPLAYRFGEGRTGNTVLQYGWSHPEPLGIWSEGDEASIVLPLPGVRRVRFNGQAYREGTVELSVNGRCVYRGATRGLGDNNEPVFVCDIDPAERCEITFRFSGIHSPSFYGESEDTRELGYFLRWLEVAI